MSVLDGDRFVSGSLETGRLVFDRSYTGVVECPVLLLRGTLVDNGDSTFDITFPGS